ncbi:hypothetical protein [Streptomyces sp. NPDC047453]|uniref:hypothetical protein n=1 Tax=Streptomyces sp. NPDC047453 TaxID=3154812 RepID=UPI0033CC97AA
MGRHTWGKAAAGVVLAVAVAVVSGCGPEGKKPSPPSVTKAAAAFQDAVVENASGSCTQEPGACWEQMTAVIQPARLLRKAMNADKNVSPEFWTEAYALIEKMEAGYAVGEDRGAGFNSNRPAVFGTAHDLSDWLDEHPTK